MNSDLVNLYYAEVCDTIPGVVSKNETLHFGNGHTLEVQERTTEFRRVLTCVPRSVAEHYVASFDHFRARWRYEETTERTAFSFMQVDKQVQQVLNKHYFEKNGPTDYKPAELDELRNLWQQLPTQHRETLREEIRSKGDAL